MNLLASLLSSLFPFDTRIDTRLGHRHLIMAYCVVWVAQVCYMCYLLLQWRSASRTDLRVVDVSDNSDVTPSNEVANERASGRRRT
jgi:uncharacterized membrane protein